MSIRTPGQQEILDFLGSEAAHGGSKPKRIETHAAYVFLAGPDVYKVKRSVKLPFLDYSTLEKRRQACEAEIDVNRRNAPKLYLGTVPITRSPTGLAIGGVGEVVEWAVHLRRFDESQTFDHLAAEGRLTPAILRSLAQAIVRSHQGAPVCRTGKAAPALSDVIDETCAELNDAGEGLALAATAEFTHKLQAAFSEVRPLLVKREASGQVRECHGDLHLRNIALIDGEPTLFDAIEFDPAISTIDVLYDLAFLLMDLWVGKHEREANLVLNRYLWSDPSVEASLAGLAVLPLFLALRSAIRAKVEALRFQQSGEEEALLNAKRYVGAGAAFLSPSPAGLVAVGGLSGSGKSTLAARIAPQIGRPPGAVHLRSDIERKRLFGVDELERLPQSAYAAEPTRQTYERVRRLAGLALGAGQVTIVDATYSEPVERQALLDAAAAARVPFRGLWLKAARRTRVERVVGRTDDASDATAQVAAAQDGDGPAVEDWAVVDASGSLDGVERAALEALKPFRA